jgi:hypothetical protein
MPRDEKRRQAAAQRRAARSKEKRKVARAVVPAGPSAVFRTSGKWPLHEVLVAKAWSEEGGLVQIIVARRSPSGAIAAGVFLVDLGCLGVKNAFGRLFESEYEYERELRDGITSSQEMVSADLDLAAKIIREGIEYARRLGFSPDRDYPEAATVLAGANPDACAATIPLGKDGKPFYVAGPHDNVRKIMARLAKVAGPGKYESLVPISPDEEFVLADGDEAELLEEGEGEEDEE